MMLSTLKTNHDLKGLLQISVLYGAALSHVRVLFRVGNCYMIAAVEKQAKK